MKTRPKFCVGEEVAVTCFNQPHIARTEVTSIHWRELAVRIESMSIYTGWVYKVADQIDPRTTAMEKNVHKLPPEERLSMNDLMESLKSKEGVES